MIKCKACERFISNTDCHSVHLPAINRSYFSSSALNRVAHTSAIAGVLAITASVNSGFATELLSSSSFVINLLK